jgi:hypothetical protein
LLAASDAATQHDASQFPSNSLASIESQVNDGSEEAVTADVSDIGDTKSDDDDEHINHDGESFFSPTRRHRPRPLLAAPSLRRRSNSPNDPTDPNEAAPAQSPTNPPAAGTEVGGDDERPLTAAEKAELKRARRNNRNRAQRLARNQLLASTSAGNAVPPHTASGAKGKAQPKQPAAGTTKSTANADQQQQQQQQQRVNAAQQHIERQRAASSRHEAVLTRYQRLANAQKYLAGDTDYLGAFRFLADQRNHYTAKARAIRQREGRLAAIDEQLQQMPGDRVPPAPPVPPRQGGRPPRRPRDRGCWSAGGRWRPSWRSYTPNAPN